MVNSNTYITEFKKLLLDFFSHIYSSREFWAENKTIYDSAMSLYSKLKSAEDTSWYLSIDPPWIVSLVNDDYFGKYEGYLVIGGEIEVGDEEFKKYNFYFSVVRNSRSPKNSKDRFLSCCEKNPDARNKSRIVRRFHFDAGEGKPEILEAKSHMQFGGICHEEQTIGNFEGADLHYCLDNKIKIPRFPYPPVDIILLLDILLRQFGTSIDRSFVEKKEWLKLVSRSEDCRLDRYYSEINKYFAEKKGKAKIQTLFEFLCEKECIF